MKDCFVPFGCPKLQIVESHTTVLKDSENNEGRVQD